MKYNGVGIAIFHPDLSKVLMIRDSRSQKWSFPKGQVEDYDPFSLATGIREVSEETKFVYGRDYAVNVSDKQIHGKYLLYSGISTRSELVCTTNPDEFVDEVAWVSVNEVDKLSLNYPSRSYCISAGWIPRRSSP